MSPRTHRHHHAALGARLQARLTAAGVRSLLLVSATGALLDESWAGELDGVRVRVVTGRMVDTLTRESPRFDAAIACDVLEELDPADGRRLVAHLRDVIAPLTCVVVDPHRATGWSHATFIALGFVRDAVVQVNGSSREVHVHHVHDYRPTPQWFGPEHWANPELWDRHRW